MVDEFIRRFKDVLHQAFASLLELDGVEFLCLALSEGSGEKFAAFSMARAVRTERNRARVSKTTQNEKRKYNLQGRRKPVNCGWQNWGAAVR